MASEDFHLLAGAEPIEGTVSEAARPRAHPGYLGFGLGSDLEIALVAPGWKVERTWLGHARLT